MSLENKGFIGVLFYNTSQDRATSELWKATDWLHFAEKNKKTAYPFQNFPTYWKLFLLQNLFCYIIDKI